MPKSDFGATRPRRREKNMENEALDMVTSSRVDSAPKADWTVMVFMGADNPPEDRPLHQEAEADLQEMEQAGSTDSVNIVVQLHRPRAEPVRYAIKQGKRQPEKVPAGEVDTGDPIVLGNFIRWAYENYPAKHNMLVLWGHAYRFAFGYYRNPQTLAVDGLNFCEVSDVLKKFKAESMRGRKMDIVAFDACDVSSVEIAYQVQHVASYLIGSQIGVPLPGWPYNTILDKLTKTPGMSPEELGAFIVRRFVRNYDQGPSSLTMLDLAKAIELPDVLKNLVKAFHGLSGNSDELERVRRLFYQAQVLPGKPYVDLADLSLNLNRFSRSPAVKKAAAAIGDLLIRTTNPFVAEHGKNSHQTAKLQGVNIYAPHVESGHDWKGLVGPYSSLALSQETGWGEFIFVLAIE
jgi:hypothetical protein